MSTLSALPPAVTTGHPQARAFGVVNSLPCAGFSCDSSDSHRCQHCGTSERDGGVSVCTAVHPAVSPASAVFYLTDTNRPSPRVPGFGFYSQGCCRPGYHISLAPSCVSPGSSPEGKSWTLTDRHTHCLRRSAEPPEVFLSPDLCSEHPTGVLTCTALH